MSTRPGFKVSPHRPKASLPTRHTSVPRLPSTWPTQVGVSVHQCQGRPALQCVCCITADQHLKLVTRTTAQDAIYPTKSQDIKVDIFNIETLKITSALMPRDIVYFIMDWPVMPPILMQQVDETEPTEPDASGSDLAQLISLRDLDDMASMVITALPFPQLCSWFCRALMQWTQWHLPSTSSSKQSSCRE